MKLLSDENRRFFLIPLAALIAVLPLIQHGVSCGHDFDFHLVSWMEAARQFSQGTLHPHWAFTPAYNAGEPRFVFYPPLSWMLGGLLGLLPYGSEGAAWGAAPIAFTWIALCLSGLTLYRLSRDFASANASLIAAILYLGNPYMLFDAYERTAYGELLAAAWIPLLFHSILRDRVTIPRIALPVALLWLSNAPAAVMGSYTLALLATLRLIRGAWYSKNSAIVCHRSSPRVIARNTLAGTILGLALAAFYLVPAAYERQFVQSSMVITGHDRIDRNFLFEHTGISSVARHYDAITHTVSLIAVTLLLATALALSAIHFCRRSENSEVFASSIGRTWDLRYKATFPSGSCAILTAAIILLLTPLSLPLWNYIPQAAYVQFPWRLLTILAPVFSLATARALELFSRGTILSSTRYTKASMFGFFFRSVKQAFSPWGMLFFTTALSAALVLPAIRNFRQPCRVNRTPLARLVLFRSIGSRPMREYTPTTAHNGNHSSTNPPYWLAYSAEDPAPPDTQPGPAPTHLTVTAPYSEFLILNLRDYPSWHITLNGEPMPHPGQLFSVRYDGLIAIQLPAGVSTIDIHYLHSFDQSAGDAISLVSLALFIFMCASPIADL
jgi:hypothetical protein